jgi:hypothetical protein
MTEVSHCADADAIAEGPKTSEAELLSRRHREVRDRNKPAGLRYLVEERRFGDLGLIRLEPR